MSLRDGGSLALVLEGLRHQLSCSGVNRFILPGYEALVVLFIGDAVRVQARLSL